MNKLVTYSELILAQKQNNWQLLCKPADALDFQPFDYWQLPKERKMCKWEIKTIGNDTDLLTTSRSSRVG